MDHSRTNTQNSVNVWYPTNKNMWDMTMLQSLTKGGLYPSPVRFTENPLTDEGLVIVASGVVLKHQGDEELKRVLGRVPWALIIYTSDESLEYDLSGFRHPRSKLWTQYINMPGARHIPVGWSPNTRTIIGGLPKLPLCERRHKWAFAGQVNHEHRQRMVGELKKLGGGELLISGGFTQGLPQDEYYKLLTETAITPCPSGNRYPDSFRIWESLEAGCLPIVEEHGIDWNESGYWNQINPPFPIVKDWAELQTIIPQYISDPVKLQHDANVAQVWWSSFKRKMVYDLIDDVRELSGR